jgi:hypothetical protein
MLDKDRQTFNFPNGIVNRNGNTIITQFNRYLGFYLKTKQVHCIVCQNFQI